MFFLFGMFFACRPPLEVDASWSVTVTGTETNCVQDTSGFLESYQYDVVYDGTRAKIYIDNTMFADLCSGINDRPSTNQCPFTNFDIFPNDDWRVDNRSKCLIRMLFCNLTAGSIITNRNETDALKIFLADDRIAIHLITNCMIFAYQTAHIINALFFERVQSHARMAGGPENKDCLFGLSVYLEKRSVFCFEKRSQNCEGGQKIDEFRVELLQLLLGQSFVFHAAKI